MAFRKILDRKEQFEPAGDGLKTVETTETIINPDGSTRTVTTRTTTSSNRGGHRDAFESFPKDMKNAFKDDDFDPKGRSGKKANDRADVQNGAVEPKPKGPSSSPPKGPFGKQCTDAHNKYRAMHGVPPLQWSDEIARDAERYAQKLAKQRTLRHSDRQERDGTGENLAMFTGKFDTAGEEATEMWYGEIEDYNFKRGGWQSGTGHFTQVVWKESKELGIGRAQTADGRQTYVVGRYRPAGNVTNRVAENVFPKTR